MFDWFWEFLYGLSKSIFNLIDGLMMCANKLCGIEPILVEGEEVSFMSYLIYNDRVSLGFKTAALIGIILVGIFALFAIIRSIASEKSGTTPTQVFVKTFKTMLMFLFVPVCMIVLIHFTNIFMEALYAATLGANSDGIGRFLCGAFSQNALNPGVSSTFYLEPSFDYMDVDALWGYIDVSDFDFFFSWIAGFCILFALGNALLMFVDRAISIVVLYIVAPISMSTSVIDDGAHFKLWRDQIMVKFLTGYGCILVLNVYILIIALISNDAVEFYPDSWFLNNLLKIAFIIGGSVSMQRAMALIGNLVAAGAGSNELRDNAIAAAGFKGAAKTFGSAMLSPFTAARASSNFIRDWSNYGFGSTLGNRLGFKTDRDYGIKTQKQQEKETESKRKEHQQLAGFIGDKVAEAINGNNNNDQNGNRNEGGNRPEGNNNGGNNRGNNMVENAINQNNNGQNGGNPNDNAMH